MILGGRHKCMTPKVCGYSMVLGSTNEYNKLRDTSVSLVNKPGYKQKQKNIINLFSLQYPHLHTFFLKIQIIEI